MEYYSHKDYFRQHLFSLFSLQTAKVSSLYSLNFSLYLNSSLYLSLKTAKACALCSFSSSLYVSLQTVRAYSLYSLSSSLYLSLQTVKTCSLYSLSSSLYLSLQTVKTCSFYSLSFSLYLSLQTAYACSLYSLSSSLYPSLQTVKACNRQDFVSPQAAMVQASPTLQHTMSGPCEFEQVAPDQYQFRSPGFPKLFVPEMSCILEFEAVSTIIFILSSGTAKII